MAVKQPIPKNTNTKPRAKKPAAPPPAPSPAPAQGQGPAPVNLPAGGKVYAPSSGGQFVVYDIGGGRLIYYSVPPSAGGNLGPPIPIDSTQFHQMVVASKMGTYGGDASELVPIQTSGQTYQDWLNHKLQTYTAGAPWADDPEVRAIWAESVVNPEVSQQEIQAKLQQTNYYRSHNAAQQSYAQQSPAEQARQDQIAAVALNQQYMQINGRNLPLSDPDLQKWAHQVASGATTAGQIVEDVFKPLALKDQNSPWSRTLHDEHKAEGQQQVDVTNQREQLRQLYGRWGVPVSEQMLTDQATKLEANDTSLGDITKSLSQQAQVLYPWKDPNVETETAAQPWIQTYSRVLERSPSGLLDPKLQKALNSGQPLYQFESDLKHTDEWIGTKNAHQQLQSAFADFGKLTGFQ